MRLSIVCLFKKSVNGHIFRGKDRLVKRVSKIAMQTLRNEYDRQEACMLLLRHPYLTPVSLPSNCAVIESALTPLQLSPCRKSPAATRKIWANAKRKWLSGIWSRCSDR